MSQDSAPSAMEAPRNGPGPAAPTAGTNANAIANADANANAGASEKPTPKAARKKSRPAAPAIVAGETSRWTARCADAGLVALFLTLTFLLGAFPLKDADVYWHLRTGDWIRQTGRVPRVDLFTFTRTGAPWIDLHWMFQVAMSWLHERGGVVALNLAKCAITCWAVLLLVTARRREWPLWAMLLAWLPAIFLLGGRIYVRPETLTLLYLASFLAVTARWGRWPVLAWLLPFIQMMWVNSQGLFVLGPIVLACSLVDAALDTLLGRGPFATDARRWWRIVGLACLATGGACLVNPYGLRGALYPLELAGTMRNPIFSQSIAELKPIPDFIAEAGFHNLPLQLHLATMALGALSFLVPLLWRIGAWFRGARGPVEPKPKGNAKSKPGGKSNPRAAPSKKPSKGKTKRPRDETPDGAGAGADGWRLRPSRLLLYVAFSLLSLQATRNSHQFAAVVGTLTAWNVGEWAAAVTARRRAIGRGPRGVVPPAPRIGAPRWAAAVVLLAAIAWVGSGEFFAMTGEKRTIGLGEDRFFFPHAAARFAGLPEMPERFLGFHIGNAALFEYYHGPERKVFIDPRLEVAGAELFERYTALQKAIAQNSRGWREQLDAMGRPVVLVDHEYDSTTGAALLRDEHWRCVWFDPIAAVFVHDSAAEAVRRHQVDFADRHFQSSDKGSSIDVPERLALARGYRNYASALPAYRRDLVGPLEWLGLDAARAALRAEPSSAAAWALLGQIEFRRQPPGVPSPRFRLPYDPTIDLSLVRSTYALRRGLELAPGDVSSLHYLDYSFENRGMTEAQAEVWDAILALPPHNRIQRSLQETVAAKRDEHRRDPAARAAPGPWRNLNELGRIVEGLLGAGRAATAADLLERAYPPARAPWEKLDRMALLRLHLGEPARARAIWKARAGAKTKAPFEERAPALARIGATYLVENDFEAARRAFREALSVRPGLFEASYSLAVLEQDAGDAPAAAQWAQNARAHAPDDRTREAAEMVLGAVERFPAP